MYGITELFNRKKLQTNNINYLYGHNKLNF